MNTESPYLRLWLIDPTYGTLLLYSSKTPSSQPINATHDDRPIVTASRPFGWWPPFRSLTYTALLVILTFVKRKTQFSSKKKQYGVRHRGRGFLGGLAALWGTVVMGEAEKRGTLWVTPARRKSPLHYRDLRCHQICPTFVVSCLSWSIVAMSCTQDESAQLFLGRRHARPCRTVIDCG